MKRTDFYMACFPVICTIMILAGVGYFFSICAENQLWLERFSIIEVVTFLIFGFILLRTERISPQTVSEG